MSNKKNFEIAFQLGAKMDPSVKKAFGDASKQLSNMKKNIGSTIKNGAKLAVGFAGAATAVVGSAALMANKFAATGDRIDKLSQRLGMSRQGFQEWEFILSQSGSSMESLQSGMKVMVQRMDDLKSGTGVGAEAFAKLGIKYKDISKLSQEDVFKLTIDRFNQMEDGAEKAALAQDLFSRSGQDLLPLLNSNAGAVDEMKKKAHDLGLVVGDDAVDAAVLWTDTMDQGKRALGGLFNTVASNALPVLQKFLNYGIEKLPMLQEKVSSAMTIAGKVFSWVGENGLKAFQSIKNSIQDNQPVIDKIRDTIVSLAQKGMEFYKLIKDNWSTISPILLGLGGAILIVKAAMLTMAIVQTVTGFMTAFGGATVAAKLSMLGLNGAMLANPMTWVVAGIMALIAAGVLLWKNWDTVKVKAKEIWDAMINVIRGPANTIIGFANGIITAYENMINAVGGAINKIPSIKLPEWLGGGEFGIPKIPKVSLPRIPMLAEGGITTGPTLAMIGEGAEQEVVLPISKLQALLKGDYREKQAINIVYSPQFNIPEGATRREIEEITRKGYYEFKQWMKRYENEKQRLSF